MIEEKETKKRRTIYLELGKLTIKIDGVMRKQLEIASAMNDLDFKLNKIFEGLNQQIDQLTVIEGIQKNIETHLPTIRMVKLQIDSVLQKLDQTVKPKHEPRQSVVPKLPTEIAKQLSFGDDWIQPKDFLPKQVWSEANATLFKQGYKWSSNGKHGSWRKQ